MIKKAIIRRQCVSATHVQGVGAYGSDGTRDVTAWILGIQIKPGMGDDVAVLPPPGMPAKTILHTVRADRSDEALRIQAAERFFKMTGAQLEIEMAPAAPVVQEPKAVETKPVSPAVPRRERKPEKAEE